MRVRLLSEHTTKHPVGAILEVDEAVGTGLVKAGIAEVHPPQDEPDGEPESAGGKKNRKADTK